METNDLINHLSTFSYLGLLGISFISNVIIPVPEEVVILSLGYLAAGPKINGMLLLPIVFVGLILSDIAMYFLSLKSNRLIKFFYEKVFAKKLENRQEWLKNHINKVIFFSRFLVQLRFLGPFLAGQMKIPFKNFLILDSLALLVYVPMYMIAGWYFRSRIEFLVSGINSLKNIIIIIICFLFLFSVSKIIKNFLLNNKNFDEKNI